MNCVRALRNRCRAASSSGLILWDSSGEAAEEVARASVSEERESQARLDGFSIRFYHSMWFFTW
jgi:hypothetical protein